MFQRFQVQSVLDVTQSEIMYNNIAKNWYPINHISESFILLKIVKICADFVTDMYLALV